MGTPDQLIERLQRPAPTGAREVVLNVGNTVRMPIEESVKSMTLPAVHGMATPLDVLGIWTG